MTLQKPDPWPYRIAVFKPCRDAFATDPRACKRPPWDCNHLSLAEVYELAKLAVAYMHNALAPYEVRHYKELAQRKVIVR